MRNFLLSCLVLILPLPLLAQHGGWCACGRHGTEPAFFQIDHTITSFQNAASTSFARWDAYSDVFSWGIGNGAAGANGINEIIFFNPATTLSQYGLVIDSNTFGITYIDPLSAFGDPPFNACPPPAGTTCNFFDETDVIMNADFSRGWTTGPPNFDDTGPASYHATALHEMGHALGIHHNFDTLTTMNYYEDYATQYLSLSDGKAARDYHTSQARTTIDMATYPFRFSGFQYSGTTVASPSPSSVEQGGQFSLQNFTIEKPGSETLSQVRLRLYLSTNNIISSSDYLIGTVSFTTFSTWWDSTGTNLTVPMSVPPGTYYIGAIVYYNTDQLDGITYNNSWVLDASRRLTVTASSCSTDGFEPDDSSAQAKAIASGVPKSHSICPVGDGDWSVFTLSEESAITLETSGPSGDTRMWLYDAGLGQVEFDDDGGSGTFSFIDRTCGVDALPAGTYYVMVDEFGDDDEIPSYSLTYTLDASCAIYTLTVSGSGSGSGTVSGSGINCTITSGSASGTCQQSYLSGTNVSLTATPSGGSSFGGWSGACSGTGSCNVTMSTDRSVNALFETIVTSCDYESLSNVSVTTSATYEACREVATGTGVVVTSSGDLRLAAGQRVSIGSGFSVAGKLRVSSCGQNLCTSSPNPLVSGCHSCVTEICTADPWCCNNNWDGACVTEVGSICGLGCS